jgi:hypothetical protein
VVADPDGNASVVWYGPVPDPLSSENEILIDDDRYGSQTAASVAFGPDGRLGGCRARRIGGAPRL